MAQAKSKAASEGKGAIALLTADHAAVKKMFKAYEKLIDGEGDADQKSELATSICEALTIHAAIEEEIFYPAVRAAIDDDDLMDEADVEHAEAKELIAQLDAAEPGDDHYDAKVTVLGENIDHHVREEETEMFPKVKKAKLDLAALGAKIQERKEQLEAGMSPPPAKRSEGAAKRN